jgi:hypothetical protein
MIQHYHHLFLLVKIAIVAGTALVASRTNHNPHVQIGVQTQQRSPVRPTHNISISR